jgi:hypothetical protein
MVVLSRGSFPSWPNKDSSPSYKKLSGICAPNYWNEALGEIVFVATRPGPTKCESIRLTKLDLPRIAMVE